MDLSRYVLRELVRWLGGGILHQPPERYNRQTQMSAEIGLRGRDNHECARGLRRRCFAVILRKKEALRG